MGRLPDYLKTRISSVREDKKVREILKNKGLNTVCDNARCPNKSKCYCSGTATFLIMGTKCTRNCRFCNIEKNTPSPLDKNEPKRLAQAVFELGLKYCVITSVTRDDIKDYGAEHFAKTINEIRKISPETKIEVLTPDFKGNEKSLDAVIKAQPEVFNHNIETVKELYSKARALADYEQSLNVLSYVKNHSDITTKTGIMLGLGENLEQLEKLFLDISDAKCNILTIGQYIQPSKKHLEVTKYYTPEEFEQIGLLAKKCGINEVVSGPLVRSSFMAKETYDNSCKKFFL